MKAPWIVCGLVLWITSFVSAGEPALHRAVGFAQGGIGGRVRLDPVAERYPAGSAVRFIAEPNAGYEFSSWSDNTQENPRTIVISGDTACIARFRAATEGLRLRRTPDHTRVFLGSTVTWRVEAEGAAGPVIYQWLKGGTEVASATNATLRLGPVRLADAGMCTVRVADGNGTVSASTTLEVMETSAVQFSRVQHTGTVIEMDLAGPVGAYFMIESSVDGKDWDPVTTLLKNWSGVVSVAFRIEPEMRARFFRIQHVVF